MRNAIHFNYDTSKRTLEYIREKTLIFMEKKNISPCQKDMSVFIIKVPHKTCCLFSYAFLYFFFSVNIFIWKNLLHLSVTVSIMHSISRHLPIFLCPSKFFYTFALLHILEVQKYALPAWQWTLSRYVPFTLQLLKCRFDKFLRTHSINHQFIEPIQTNEAT